MIRVISIALAFVALTLVLLPFQLIGIAFDLRLQRTIPHLYHRILCALIGVRISEVGRRSAATPALILSNHVSWLDICDRKAIARGAQQSVRRMTAAALRATSAVQASPASIPERLDPSPNPA